MNKITSQRIKELEEKFESIENFQQVRSELGQLINDNESVKNQISEFSVSTSELKTASENIKQEFENKKQEIDQKVIELDTIKKSSEELNQAIENQLGMLNAEKLANAFEFESGQQEKANIKWFARFFYSICSLFIATIGIIIWEIKAGGQFLSAGFAIKLSVTAPILYFTIFIHNQFSRSKELLDEYTFKAAVARSFEAYRQIFKEDCITAENKIDPVVTNFFVETVKDIYKSPCKSQDDLISDKQAKGILERVVDFFIKGNK